MGNSHSEVVEKFRPNTSPFGQLYIETDPRAYYEEEMVTGTVYLNLHCPYAKCKLTVEFKGKEKSHFIEVSHETRGNRAFTWIDTDVSEYKSKGGLYESTFTIHKWDNLEAGQHAVPFSIRLPKGLYSSFEFHEMRERISASLDCLKENDKNTYSASVRYRLTARLEPEGMGAPPLKYKHQINIRETPPKHNLEQYQKLEVPSMSLFCWNRGKTTVNIELERDFASYGESLPLRLTVDNSQSQIPSEMITVKLFHSLGLKAEHRDFNERNVKYKARFAGIPAGQVSQENLINIELVKGGMQSTVDVGLVKSSYELEIWVGDNGCGGPAQKCVIPISIGCGDGVYIPIEIPQAWNPQRVGLINTALQVEAALENISGMFNNNNGDMVATDMITHNNIFRPLLKQK